MHTWARVAVLAMSAPWAAAQGPPLTVCVAQDNEPLSYISAGRPKGLDVRIAQAIADELGRELRIVPFDTDYEKESSLAQEVNALLSSQVCELASGFPLLREDLGAPPRPSARTPDYPGAKRRRERPFVTLQPLTPSRPYLGMTLVVVRRVATRQVNRLADLSGERIGTVAGTLSNALLMSYRNGMLRRDLISLAQRGPSVFERMASNQFDAVLVPAGLFDAWRLEHPDTALTLTAYRRPLGVNLGFAAAPAGAQALSAADRVIERSLERGQLAEWAAAEGVSWMPPTQPAVSRAPSLIELANDP